MVILHHFIVLNECAFLKPLRWMGPGGCPLLALQIALKPGEIYKYLLRKVVAVPTGGFPGNKVGMLGLQQVHRPPTFRGVGVVRG